MQEISAIILFNFRSVWHQIVLLFFSFHARLNSGGQTNTGDVRLFRPSISLYARTASFWNRKHFSVSSVFSFMTLRLFCYQLCFFYSELIYLFLSLLFSLLWRIKHEIVEWSSLCSCWFEWFCLFLLHSDAFGIVRFPDFPDTFL